MKPCRTRHTNLSCHARHSSLTCKPSPPNRPRLPRLPSRPSQPGEYSQPRTPSLTSQSSKTGQSSVPSSTSNTLRTSRPSPCGQSSQRIKSSHHSHSSQSIAPSRRNMSSVRVRGGLTPTLTTNKSIKNSQANHAGQSSLPRHTGHNSQYSLTFQSREDRLSIQFWASKSGHIDRSIHLNYSIQYSIPSHTTILVSLGIHVSQASLVRKVNLIALSIPGREHSNSTRPYPSNPPCQSSRSSLPIHTSR